MLIRIVVLLICLAATGWYVREQQNAGKLQRVDDLFLDFLVANARDRLQTPTANPSSEVVLVQLRQEDAAEYASWPPPPLDWHTLFHSLRAYTPRVLVVATPLNWGRPAPDFVPAVAEALLPYPSTIMAAEGQLAEAKSATPAFMGNLSDSLPRFRRIDGDIGPAPKLGALITAPDDAFKNFAEIGIVTPGPSPTGALLPYAIREADTLIPSLLAQAISRYSRSPYALQRLRLGPGAGAYLQEGFYVPLQADASFKVDTRTTVPVVNALHLMTGTLADGTDTADKTALGSGKIVVIGFDPAPTANAPRTAYLHAQALAQMLSLPRLQMLPPLWQWIAAAIAGLAALWLVSRVRRSRALIGGVMLIFAALLVSFLLFQSNLIWFPPTMPISLIVTGILVTALIGRKTKIAPPTIPAPVSA